LQIVDRIGGQGAEYLPGCLPVVNSKAFKKAGGLFFIPSVIVDVDI